MPWGWSGCSSWHTQTQFLIIMMVDQLLTILVRHRMMLITIISIQKAFVFNLKYQMIYVVIPKHFMKMTRQLVEIFPICLADVNIYRTKWVMVTCRLASLPCSVIFGNLCGNQIHFNSVTLVVFLSGTFLLRWQAVKLCTELFYYMEIRHRKEIYQLNSQNSLERQCRLSVSDPVVFKGCLSVSNHNF